MAITPFGEGQKRFLTVDQKLKKSDGAIFKGHFFSVWTRREERKPRGEGGMVW